MRQVCEAGAYPCTVEELWDVVTDFGALAQISGSAVSFEGLPSGKMTEGQIVTTTISLLGVTPRTRYEIHIDRKDEEARIVRSLERGFGIKAWNHTSCVVTNDSGSILIDYIEIDAGWNTLATALWAKLMYRRRHRARLTFIKNRAELLAAS